MANKIQTIYLRNKNTNFQFGYYLTLQKKNDKQKLTWLIYKKSFIFTTSKTKSS